MKKYNIEGNIKFFDELYKSLDNEDSKEDIENYEEKCLISNEPLTDKYVSLNCGHKFNYIPLYNDIINHKTKFNYMESLSRRLTTNEIRCPYCRRKHQGVLPYYQEFGLKKVNGVNYYDPYSKTNAYHKCEYLYPNQNYDPNKPESNMNTPYLNNTTCHMTGFKIAIYNSENPSQPINYGDSKHYCYYHQQIMIKKYKNEEKEKIKLAKKEAKELEKQMKKLEKENIKAMEKEEKYMKKFEEKMKKLEKQNKQKTKPNINDESKANNKVFNNKLMTENVVLGPSNIGNLTGCVQILKTGPNKGTPCGCKIFSDNMCKRHIPKK
jgi:hypothetical protein